MDYRPGLAWNKHRFTLLLGEALLQKIALSLTLVLAALFDFRRRTCEFILPTF